MSSEHLKMIRAYELEKVLIHIPPNSTILEIGAGSGYQANILNDNGHKLHAIDVINNNKDYDQIWPVQNYDGKSIPFQDDYFDVVFSSNVLEHIKYIHTFQDEIQRVLKPEGIAIHILPTSSWRIWTSISYYFFMLKITLIIMIKLLNRSEDINPIGETTHASTKTKYILNAFFPTRHGQRGTSINEIYYFNNQKGEE